MKHVIIALIGLTLNACATLHDPTDQYAALDARRNTQLSGLLQKMSETHRYDQGNPETGGPAHMVGRTCSSIPIFGLRGEFLRYHVECR